MQSPKLNLHPRKAGLELFGNGAEFGHPEMQLRAFVFGDLPGLLRTLDLKDETERGNIKRMGNASSITEYTEKSRNQPPMSSMRPYRTMKPKGQQ